jgi:hypothetical protein
MKILTVRNFSVGVGLMGMLLSASLARAHAASGSIAGKTRTYYIAADEGILSRVILSAEMLAPPYRESKSDLSRPPVLKFRALCASGESFGADFIASRFDS